MTAVRCGLDELGPRVWGSEPCELVIAGPNEFWNMADEALNSGTIHMAMYAAANRKIPAIAVAADEEPRSEAEAGLCARLVCRLADVLVRPGPRTFPRASG